MTFAGECLALQCECDRNSFCCYGGIEVSGWLVSEFVVGCRGPQINPPTS